MNYYTEKIVKKFTDEVMTKGHLVLQIYKMADNDRHHAEILLNIINPPLNASLLDAGCGVGAISEYMSDIRPDLDFTLLNISPYQLSLCRDHFKKICADFHHVPFPDNSFDVVMLNYSMGHARLSDLFAECHRLLNPNGILFIYDVEGEECEELTKQLNYTAHTIQALLAATRGFKPEIVGRPVYATSRHMENLLDSKQYHEIFHDINPIIYKFRKVCDA